MAVITMRQLLEAGVHFGHQTRRWNPKMRRFIFGERNGIYIIDLEQTLARVEKAYGFVRDLVADGGVLMFVGTKKQAQDPVRSYAEKCGMPYVNERWLGGMLTNFDTISKRISKMLEYERMRDSGEFDAMPKKEALLLTRELEKLQRNLGGLRGLTRRPDAIFVLDTKKESIAVTEANKLGIPVVAVVDTNVDPELVQYPIPGNDDAIRANSLLARVIADAVEEGRYIAAKRESSSRPTRSSEEEEAFNAQQAAARREAAAAQAARDRRLETVSTPSADETAAAATADNMVTEQDTDASSGPADQSDTAGATVGEEAVDAAALAAEPAAAQPADVAEPAATQPDDVAEPATVAERTEVAEPVEAQPAEMPETAAAQPADVAEAAGPSEEGETAAAGPQTAVAATAGADPTSTGTEPTATGTEPSATETETAVDTAVGDADVAVEEPAPASTPTES